MIPLMMTQGYKPKGVREILSSVTTFCCGNLLLRLFVSAQWLGLILGTRLWYAFSGAESDDDAAFERRLDAVCREIGDRGKVGVSEGVPPLHEPTPAPAPARVPKRAPTPAPALAPAPAPAPVPRTPTLAPPAATTVVSSFTPSMQQASPTPQAMEMVQSPSSGQEGSSFAMMSAFFAGQQAREDRMRAEMDRLREEAVEGRVRSELQAQVEREREQRERKESEARLRTEMRADVGESKLRERQLAALQSRLESLHASNLLSDEDLYQVEDVIADSFEEQQDSSAEGGGGQLAKMVLLSEKVPGDAALARQLRRKFCAGA